MSCPVTQPKGDNHNVQRFYDDYEPIDLTAIYFPTIVPPPELTEAWERYRSAYASIRGITERKIGNTRYRILTDCDGSEKLLDKIRRLIFSDISPCMEANPE